MSSPENGLLSSNAGRGGGEDAASLGFENFGRKGLRPRGKRPRTFCFQSGCDAEAWTVQTRWADNFDAQQPCQGQRDALAALNWSAGYSGQSAAHRKQMHEVVHELVKEREKPRFLKVEEEAIRILRDRAGYSNVAPFVAAKVSRVVAVRGPVAASRPCLD